MNLKNFNLLMTSLSERIKKCEQELDKVKTTDDLLKLTLSEIVELVDFCKNEYEIMTKIAMVDFYHIVGMGNLTPPQMIKFTYSMKDYLKYRPDITNIKSNLDSITKLPQLPTKTKFRLLALCDLTLTKNVRFDENEIEFEDKETMDAYTRLKSKESLNEAQTKTQVHHPEPENMEAMFSLRGNNIIIKIKDLETFFNQVAPKQSYYSRFLEKVKEGKTALGIKWKKPCDTDINYVGTLTKDKKQELVDKFNLLLTFN